MYDSAARYAVKKARATFIIKMPIFAPTFCLPFGPFFGPPLFVNKSEAWVQETKILLCILAASVGCSHKLHWRFSEGGSMGATPTPQKK